MPPIRIVNVPDLSSGEPFVAVPEIDERRIEWIGHSGLPANAVERAIRRPRLSRYRAAWQAVSDAQGADLVISHLPRMTAAVEHLAGFRRARRPHLAFSFNFTDIPSGRDLRRLSTSFRDVERFCVYSNYEARTYPEIFGLHADRFRHVMWGQSAPVVDADVSTPDRPFVVAVGGEGRDYAGILTAARQTPHLHWIVIARPSPLLDDVPGNVSVFFNVSAPRTWGIAARAAAVVVPLLSEQTCCGHITIASAQQLGLPLLTTRSLATQEYVEDIPGTVVVPPGNPDALATAAAAIVADPDVYKKRAGTARPVAEARYDRAAWGRYVADFVREIA